MAKSLKIAGMERWPDYRRGSLTISQILTSQVDNCSFAVKGAKPLEGSEVIIEDSNLTEPRLFAGTIDRVELVNYKAPLVWKVDCQDYTLQMDKKLVVETYLGLSADAIVRDILLKYCPGFSAAGVASGAPVIESTGTEFNYKMPSECIKWLCDYIGWQWYVDYYKVVHFFDPAQMGTSAPMTLQAGGRFSNFKVSIDHQGLRNRVYVLGGSMLSDPQTIEWKADGSARIWVLPWLPNECSLQVGGTVQNVGVEGVDEEDAKDYLVNLSDGYLRCSADTDTPESGVTISLTARQSIDVITMVDDLASQASIAVLEGGDGVYEHYIKDDTLTTIEAAEAAGNADLREWANPKTRGSFVTAVPGWEPGQLVSIELPERGVNAVFLVQKVTISLSEVGLWIYTIEYGGRLLGIADFLKALVSAQQKKKMNDTKLIHKFVYGTEAIAIKDVLLTAGRNRPWLVESCASSAVMIGG